LLRELRIRLRQEKQGRETAEVMQPLAGIAIGMAEIEVRTERDTPTVIT
jgi:hypothetical protein